MQNHKQILIHAIKTIQYRFVKATHGSKEDFGVFKIGGHTRTPNQIINHMFDLAAKTKSMIKENHFNVTPPTLLDFNNERERLLNELNDLNFAIELCDLDLELCKKLLQGPILDMATHVGQIAMLNGLHGNMIPKESYYNAQIE
jgi:hypothetical protein